MNCKNCNYKLALEANFCNHCGAKVVTNRITVKTLFSEVFINAFGWDNKYFITIIHLLIRPDIVLKEYLDGVRKKYVNPIAFFAIGAAISLFIFNFFAEEYIAINKSQTSSMSSFTQSLIPNYDKFTPEQKIDFIKNQEVNQENMLRYFLKYFNLLAFILLPIYTLWAYWTYRKPYNYGEHLIINFYLQGITFLTTNLFFILAVFISPKFFLYSVFIVMGYYLYAYKKLYTLTFGKTIIKLFKFIGILILSVLVIMILGMVVGIAHKIIKNKLGF